MSGVSLSQVDAHLLRWHDKHSRLPELLRVPIVVRETVARTDIVAVKLYREEAEIITFKAVIVNEHVVAPATEGIHRDTPARLACFVSPRLCFVDIQRQRKATQ